jgi:predicted pyridoxine 5'-phosphate oxidase superfamily flavin-nucleotide-binding protein
LLARFEVQRQRPRSVLIVNVEAVFFQCARAVLRSGLWDASKQVDRSRLPSIGTILADLSESRLGGERFDRLLQGRLNSTLY